MPGMYGSLAECHFIRDHHIPEPWLDGGFDTQEDVGAKEIQVCQDIVAKFQPHSLNRV